MLDAQYFGVPQRRRRVFIVGRLGNPAGAAKVLFESESLPWDSAPSRKEGQEVARGFEVGSSGSRFTELAPTLDTRCKNGPMQNQVGVGVLEVPSVSLCLHAKGTPAMDPTSETYVVQGRTFGSVRVYENECPTLPAQMGTGGGNVPCVGD